MSTTAIPNDCWKCGRFIPGTRVIIGNRGFHPECAPGREPPSPPTDKVRELCERLNNPMWSHGPSDTRLDTETTVADMREAASMLADISAERVINDPAEIHAANIARDLAIVRAEAAEAREATLREAAMPFIAHYEPWMDEYEDDVPMSSYSRVTFGQLKALRAALSGDAT